MTSPADLLDSLFLPLCRGAGFLDTALMAHPLLTLVLLVCLGATVAFLLTKDYPQTLGWREVRGWRKYLFKWPLALGLTILSVGGSLVLGLTLLFHSVVAVAGGYSYPSRATVKEVRPQENMVALNLPWSLTKVWCHSAKATPLPKAGEKVGLSPYSSCLQLWLNHRALPLLHPLPLEGATYEVEEVAKGRDHQGQSQTFVLVTDPISPTLARYPEDANSLVFTVKEGSPPKVGALVPASHLSYPNNSEKDAHSLGRHHSLANAVAGEGSE